MTARRWRVAVPAFILALLLARLGAEPFLRGLRAAEPPALAASLMITALTTVAAAWRWQAVAATQGVLLPLGGAVRAYYRSQLLNATLPLGVLGDLHRGVDHGRAEGDLRRGLRGVVGERALGQLVAVALALTLFGAVRGERAALLGGCLAVAAVAAWSVLVGRSARRVRLVGVVVAASVVVALGHAVVFLVAVHAVDPSAALLPLLPVALVVLVVSALPLNLAGWGPREGASAYAFAALGAGAARGLEVSVVYGVLALVGTLPGLVVLLGRATPAATPTPEPAALGGARD
jgi:uncharacterized membrane protein YbhN (UPF0104 family)